MKKINFQVIIMIMGLILFESILYLFSKLTPFEAFVLQSSIDKQLPLIVEFIYFYILWYLLLFIIPYIVYQKNRDLFYKYISIFVFCIIISTIIFFFFPTTIERGAIIVNNIHTFLLSLIYWIDTPVLNCFPSMHCAVCFLFIYICFSMKNFKWYYKTLLIILSILIIASTLLIKQHVIYDVIGALITFLMAILFTRIFRFDVKLKNFEEKYLLPKENIVQ